jgi:hypothetical protein
MKSVFLLLALIATALAIKVQIAQDDVAPPIRPLPKAANIRPVVLWVCAFSEICAELSD